MSGLAWPRLALVTTAAVAALGFALALYLLLRADEHVGNTDTLPSLSELTALAQGRSFAITYRYEDGSRGYPELRWISTDGFSRFDFATRSGDVLTGRAVLYDEAESSCIWSVNGRNGESGAVCAQGTYSGFTWLRDLTAVVESELLEMRTILGESAYCYLLMEFPGEGHVCVSAEGLPLAFDWTPGSPGGARMSGVATAVELDPTIPEAWLLPVAEGTVRNATLDDLRLPDLPLVLQFVTTMD